MYQVKLVARSADPHPFPMVEPLHVSVLVLSVLLLNLLEVASVKLVTDPKIMLKILIQAKIVN